MSDRDQLRDQIAKTTAEALWALQVPEPPNWKDCKAGGYAIADVLLPVVAAHVLAERDGAP